MSKKGLINLVTIPELEEYIVPLQKDEFTQLEKNILEEGCREPLIVWPNGSKCILIDGYNRYKICNKYRIPYQISKLKFKNIEEAKIWIINNQLGRRNLNPDQMSFYRGLKYESLKKSRGGYEYVESKGQNELPTAERIAKEFNVSESTIKRDSKFTLGLNFIGTFNQSLKKKILNGSVKVKKSTINLLSDPEVQKKIRIIRNEIELENKVEKVKNQMLSEVEEQLRLGKDRKMEEAQKYLSESEPIFSDTEDKLRRIKGMILSNLNKAIRNRDARSLDEIRKLIDRLQDILD